MQANPAAEYMKNNFVDGYGNKDQESGQAIDVHGQRLSDAQVPQQKEAPCHAAAGAGEMKKSPENTSIDIGSEVRRNYYRRQDDG